MMIKIILTVIMTVVNTIEVRASQLVMSRIEIFTNYSAQMNDK